MPSFVFNNSTSTFNAFNSGTMAAAATYYIIPNYSTSATSVNVSSLGAKIGPVATVVITYASAPETQVIRQRFSALPSDNGNDSMIVTITANSPYSEGNLIGNQVTEPVVSYTRDATRAYTKTRWVIPESQGFLYGSQQAATASVNAAGELGNYVRTDNAKVITTSTRAKFSTSIPVGVDSGAVGTIETVLGSGPWVFDITGLSSTIVFAPKDILSAQARVGSFGAGNIVYVTLVNTSSYSISCLAYGGTIAPTPGVINSIYSTGELELDPAISAVTTITTASWSFTVIGLKGTSNYTAGSIVTITTSSVSGGNGGEGNTVVVSGISSINQITCYSTGTSTPKLGAISGVVPTGGTGSYPTVGDATYVTTGTYSWTAPDGVTSVSVVAVGGGGGGGYVWSSGGGGGGGLGWKNNIPVTPGVSYTVVVGSGGESTANATNLSTNLGGTSYFISTATVAGYGGGRGGPGATSFGGGYGGGFLGDGGGRGGNGAFEGSWNRGGGGAGGYAGQGADNAGGYFTAYNAPAGSGAGAASGYYSSTYGVPAGGGVGIFGKGADGVGSSNYFGGGGGSGGQAGVGGEGSGQSGSRIINGGAFGGGGGGSGTSYGGGWGGQGAVRIIWGTGRAFPTTNVTSATSVIAVATATIKSSTIGGSSYNREAVSVYTNRMPYPESIGIDRVDTIVTVDTITNDAVALKLYAFNNLSSYSAGSRSVSNSLIGSENFFVAGTGTDGATVLSAYWF